MAKVVYTNRELIITSFVVLACFALTYFFPAEGTYQNLATLAAFLVVIPLLYIKLILKRDLADFGIQKGEWKKGLVAAGASLVAAIMIFYLLANFTDFLKTQVFMKSFQGNFGKFLSYEIFLMGPLMIVFDFFFRGFVMSSLLAKFGRSSVALQFAIFLVYLLITKGMNLGMAYFMITALFSGLIFYQSRSLIYSIAFSWLFILIVDAMAIRFIG